MISSISERMRRSLDPLKALIVNADDLGWTEGVNRGIAEAHRRGIVTSATLLANGPAFASAVELARGEPRLGVGVHLNLSTGAPLLPRWDVPSLVNEQGLFPGGPANLLLRRWRGLLNLAEVESEWEAQINRVRNAGIVPTHLDGHKHVHMLPGLFEVAARLARRHDIRAMRIAIENATLRACLASRNGMFSPLIARQSLQARAIGFLAMDAPSLFRRAGLVSPDSFCGISHTGALTALGLASLLNNLPEGVTELMTHPGYSDSALRGSPTRLQTSRPSEVERLTDSALRNLIAKRGIRLVNYGFLL